MADKMSIDQNDLVKDDSDDSLGSSPEAEPPTTAVKQENQQPKRKGGRKPIYATSEERKQRNRQAQAAFRERRTEYIKQLEESIRAHEQNLHNLQAAHRHAADECLMLRYKNSLLERILLEKGIDVQAELRAKTGSPNLGPTHMPQNLVQPPIQRAMLNRHGRRANSSIAPKLEPGISVASSLPTPLQVGTAHSSAASPKNSRPTPSSHSNSPTAASTFSSQHGASPAASDHITTAARPPIPQASNPLSAQLGTMRGRAPTGMPRASKMAAQQAALNHVRTGGAVPHPQYYSTQSFQNHIEQLEQEYDAAADMMDDTGEPPDTPSGPGPYPYVGEPQPMTLSSPTTTVPPTTQGLPGHAMDGVGHGQHGSYPSMTQLLDQPVDWDPFGLSASMAFPSHFSFDTSNMR